MKSLKIKNRKLSSLKPYAGNARTHSGKQIQQIASSIREFGFTNPVLIDENRTILAGHGRVEAARLLGFDRIPAVRIGDLTSEQKRAYILADNRLAEKAGWDTEILAQELQFLTSLDLDFEVEITGFETAEIDLILEGEVPSSSPNPDDMIPRLKASAPRRAKAGDLWKLGEHSVYCGDALEPKSYEILLGNKRASMVFTDPPYNVPIDGHVCGSGKIKHAEFAMASGEMTAEEFEAFLKKAFLNLKRFSKDGSIHFICMDWRHMEEILSAGKEVFSELKNLCVWNKTNGGMGSFYRSKHELVFVFKNGQGRHVNTFGLGETGRYRTNVWDYEGVTTLRKSRRNELELHPTVKPVAMVVDAIKDCSRRGDIILDPFGGSGTTVLAAERAGRVAYVMEYEPFYVDVILKRFEERTGKKPVRVLETSFDKGTSLPLGKKNAPKEAPDAG